MSHERIYVEFSSCGNHAQFWDTDKELVDGLEYVRADLLAAAQAEARELRQSRRQAIDMANDNAVLAADALRERDELRAELARVRTINQQALQSASDNLRLTRRELRELGELRAERGRNPLSNQARSNEEALVRIDDALSSLSPAQQSDSPASDLPLMARREGVPGTKAFVHPNGSDWDTWGPHLGEAVADRYRKQGWTEYRLADTNKHGLKDIELTAEMPKGARYPNETSL